VPPMPLEIISIVLARATTHGNISDHRPCHCSHRSISQLKLSSIVLFTSLPTYVRTYVPHP
jgi:hypothetical protein